MEPNEERQGNDKKAERLAKRRERRRQRLLEKTAEEREARLGKRREAWKKKTAETKSKQRFPACINFYYIYHQMFIWNRDVFRPVPDKRDPGLCNRGIPPQPGHFLPCKHLLPGRDGRRDDFGVLK